MHSEVSILHAADKAEPYKVSGEQTPTVESELVLHRRRIGLAYIALDSHRYLPMRMFMVRHGNFNA